MAVSRKNKSAVVEPSLRHVWLASLGLLVAARRESTGFAQRVVGDAQVAATRVRKAARRAESDLRSNIQGVRSQVQPKVVQFSSEVEARLAPVLDKLGLKSKANRSSRTTRKPAVKTVRRAVRKRALSKRAARVDGPTQRVAKQTAT